MLTVKLLLLSIGRNRGKITKGKWILSKHKKRDTWETQGGHIEDGETPLEATKRELFEESEIRDTSSLCADG